MRNSSGPDAAIQSSASVTFDGTLLLTVSEAAKELRVSTRFMEMLVERKDVTSIKIGRARRVPRAVLVAYIAQLQAEAEQIHAISA
jgi:excisionase family DNA binding protein